MSVASGRRACGGGIMPARSLRIIFSATSAWSTTFDASKLASDKSPDFIRSLWHVTQYVLTSWFCSSADSPAAGAVPVAGTAFFATACDATGLGFVGACVWSAETPNDTIVASSAAVKKVLIRALGRIV